MKIQDVCEYQYESTSEAYGILQYSSQGGFPQHNSINISSADTNLSTAKSSQHKFTNSLLDYDIYKQPPDEVTNKCQEKKTSIVKLIGLFLFSIIKLPVIFICSICTWLFNLIAGCLDRKSKQTVDVETGLDSRNNEIIPTQNSIDKSDSKESPTHKKDEEEEPYYDAESDIPSAEGDQPVLSATKEAISSENTTANFANSTNNIDSDEIKYFKIEDKEGT